MFHSRVHLVFIWPIFWKLRFFLCKNATCRCCFSMFLEGYFIPIFFYVSSFFCFCPMKIFSLQISKYMYMRFRICKTTPANNKNRMLIWQQLIRMLYSFLRPKSIKKWCGSPAISIIYYFRTKLYQSTLFQQWRNAEK